MLVMKTVHPQLQRGLGQVKNLAVKDKSWTSHCCVLHLVSCLQLLHYMARSESTPLFVVPCYESEIRTQLAELAQELSTFL